VTRAPDIGRTALYAAEGQLCRILDRHPSGESLELFGSKVVLPKEQKFSNLEQVSSYVSKVLQNEHVQKEFGVFVGPQIRERRGQAKAEYEYQTTTIALPVENEWALREIVILHEVAHYLVHQIHPSAQSHGPEFARTHLRLLEINLGPEVTWILGIAYADAGVQL
jgi:putative metallohydrolase (TIGR04338 family)